MPLFRTGLRSALLGLSHLLAASCILAFATTTQAQVVTDPRIAEFDPSPDHWAVLADGNPAVVRYELEVYAIGASAPLTTVDMGKPAPDADGKIRYDFSAQVAAWPLPGGDYDARVTAVGPEGAAASEPSNPFTFTTAPTSAFTYPLTVSRTGSGTVASTPAGINCGADCSESYASGTVVTLTATPASGSQFTGWASGDADCADGVVTMSAAHSCLAVFTLTQPVSLNPTTVSASVAGGNYAVSVSACAGCSWAATTADAWLTLGTNGGSGSATVPFAVQANLSTSGRTGTINIGAQFLTVRQDGLATPAISWATPDPITVGTALSSAQLNATANVPGSFVYSPGAGYVFSAGQYTLRASFTPSDPTRYTTATAYVNLTVTPVTYQLTVTRPAGGTVTGGGITCGTNGTNCQMTAAANSSIGLTATPDFGYTFTGWTGDCTGTSSSVTVVLNGPKSCGATFLAPASVPPLTDGGLPLGPPYTLTIVRPSGGVVKGRGINCGTNPKSCDVTAPGPMTVALQATPDSGYIFLAWTGDCSGSSASYLLPLEGPRQCGASFIPAADGGQKR